MTRSRKAAEDQVQAVLHTFTFELPDPNQELFFQCPSTFPFFPKFPLEIRRLIWKETFQTKYLWFSDIFGFCCSQLGDIAQPISAHINQESRIETLQHYSMLLPSATPCSGLDGSTRKQPPIFWNEERDILSLKIRCPSTFYSFAAQRSTDYEFFWRHHFLNDLQSFPTSVRTLELRMRDWDNNWKIWMENGPLCTLKHFVALKVLRIVDLNLAQGHAVITGSRAKDCVDTLTGIFRDLAAANLKSSRPTIIITNGKLPVYGPGY